MSGMDCVVEDVIEAVMNERRCRGCTRKMIHVVDVEVMVEVATGHDIQPMTNALPMLIYAHAMGSQQYISYIQGSTIIQNLHHGHTT
jgi:hypothetical protein